MKITSILAAFYGIASVEAGLRSKKERVLTSYEPGACVVFFHDALRDSELLQGSTEGYWSDVNIRFPARNSKGFLIEHFQSHRYGGSGFSYNCPLSNLSDNNNLYNIRLGFAEIYQPNCDFGKRIMDVTVNGETFVRDLDVYQRVGCEAGLVMEKEFELSGDNVEIQFTSSRENAMVSIIEIVDVSCTKRTTTTGGIV